MTTIPPQKPILFCSGPVKEPEKPAYMRQHEEAVVQGKMAYIDAQSGYQVFTELFHKKRGSCCKSGCRHCPYGFSKPGV